MYRNYFGFSERPFDVTPDPKFLYLSRTHIEALASLTYGIHERRGLIVMVGEVGTGKTMLLNAVLDRLDQNTKIAFIFNTGLTFSQMLHMALVDLQLAQPDKALAAVEALHRLNDFAIKQLSWGGNVALIIDEAQNLDRPSMENLRLLSNLETRKHKLIQIVLSGQPELDTTLSQPELRQLTQRISLRRSITPLSEKETYEYIHHRLAIADYRGPSLFSSRAQQLIWEYSGGIPRKINILCDNALLIAYGMRKKRIKAPVVEEAINDLSWSPRSSPIETSPPAPREVHAPQLAKGASHPRFALAATLVLAACLLVTVLLVLGNSRRTIQKGIYIPRESAVHVEMPRELKGPYQSPAIQEVALAGLPLPIQTKKQEPTVTPEPLPRAQDEAPPKQSRVAVVKRGDNLFRIITGAYGTYDRGILSAVLRENPGIKDPDQITVGQVIKLPEMKK